MGNRIFTSVVLLLWAAAMSWLVVARILPPFFDGEPPRSDELIHDAGIVCWRISCLGKEVGWAVSEVRPGTLDTTEVCSRVNVENIPLREMAPQWMSTFVDHVDPIQLDVESRVALDSLNQLSNFETLVRLNDLPAVIKMYGEIEGSLLNIDIQTGDIKHELSYPAPDKPMLRGELTPDARLPRMFVGRKWQREIYSPFRTPNRSVELLQAEVVEEESILFEGETTKTKSVEFRSHSKPGVSTRDSLRAEVWVADDGTVLRQDVFLINVRLRFERRLDEDAVERASKLLGKDKLATRLE